MLFIIGIQAFNARSAAVWAYPHWTRNPFTMREPLQFFHFGGYFMLAGGVGGLVHYAYDRSAHVTQPVVLAAWGFGMLMGVRVCTLVFRRKMARALTTASSAT